MRWLVKFSQVSFCFTDMSSDVDVIHPTCPSLGKVNFGLDKNNFSIHHDNDRSWQNVMMLNYHDVMTL